MNLMSNLTQAYSHVFWASIVAISDCHLAKDSLDHAEPFLSKLPPERQQAKILVAQANQMAQALSSCK